MRTKPFPSSLISLSLSLSHTHTHSLTHPPKVYGKTAAWSEHVDGWGFEGELLRKDDATIVVATFVGAILEAVDHISPFMGGTEVSERMMMWLPTLLSLISHLSLSHSHWHLHLPIQ